LIRDPSGRLNQIGAGFQQSPGFQFALQQALQGAGHASAAGGMAGSPQHEQQNMGLATNLANQDYYNFMDRALGLHGQGLQGMQGIAGMGLSAGKSLSDLIAQALAQRGAYEYAGNASQNAGLGGLISILVVALVFLGHSHKEMKNGIYFLFSTNINTRTSKPFC
jgi:hypothetical protein